MDVSCTARTLREHGHAVAAEMLLAHQDGTTVMKRLIDMMVSVVSSRYGDRDIDRDVMHLFGDYLALCRQCGAAPQVDDEDQVVMTSTHRQQGIVVSAMLSLAAEISAVNGPWPKAMTDKMWEQLLYPLRIEEGRQQFLWFWRKMCLALQLGAISIDKSREKELLNVLSGVPNVRAYSDGKKFVVSGNGGSANAVMFGRVTLPELGMGLTDFGLAENREIRELARVVTSVMHHRLRSAGREAEFFEKMSQLFDEAIV